MLAVLGHFGSFQTTLQRWQTCHVWPFLVLHPSPISPHHSAHPAPRRSHTTHPSSFLQLAADWCLAPTGLCIYGACHPGVQFWRPRSWRSRGNKMLVCFFICSSQPSIVQWLSSSIFPCLFVRPAMVITDQISTFFNVYRHKSPVLT